MENAALYGALAKAQGEFLPLAKNRNVEITMKSGGKYRFRYADLEAVLSSTRAALAKNGLSTIQVIEQVEGLPMLKTVLAHESGGTISSYLQLPRNDGGDIKNYGAAITYLRRYALTSMLCVAADDDLDESDEDTTPRGGAQSVVMPAERKQEPSRKMGDATVVPLSQPQAEQPAQVDGGPTLADGQIRMITKKAQESGVDLATIAAAFGVEAIEQIPLTKANDALALAKGGAK